MNRSENLIAIGSTDITILNEEILGILGASKMQKAGAQSFSKGVGSCWGYPGSGDST